MVFLAAASILVGQTIILYGDWLILKDSDVLSDDSFAIKDAIFSTIANLGGLLQFVLPADSPVRPYIDAVLATANGILAVWNSFAALLNAGGFLANLAWQGVKALILRLLGGAVNVPLEVATTLAGSAVGHFVNVGGHAAAIFGWSLMAQYDAERAMDISDWCSQNFHVCPSKKSFGL
jgi:hypothetical protein